MNGAAVGTIARSEVRRGWRTLVAVGVLAGIVAAVVVGALATARRTSTAYDRLAEATALDDARGMLTVDALDEVLALPQVDTSWSGRVAIGQVGKSFNYLAILAGPREPSPLFTPIVVEGRPAVGPDEIVVEESFEEVFDIGPGDRLHLRTLTPGDLNDFDTGFEGGRPNGPVVEVDVVGVVRVGGRNRDVVPAFAGPAMIDAHPEIFELGWQFFVRLDDGADGFDDFASDVEAIAATVERPEDALEIPAVDVTDPSQGRAVVATTARVLATALVLLAVAVAAGGMLAVRQVLARHFGANAGDQRVERMLGLTRAEQRWARLAAVALATGPAVVVAVAGGVAAGAIEPLAGIRDYEPNPGPAPHWGLVACGAVLVVAAVLAAGASVVGRARRPRPPADAHGGLIERIGQLGWPPPAVAGLRFALARDAEGSAAFPRTLAGIVIGVAGVTSAIVFTASLDRVVGSPERHGLGYDAVVADIDDAELSDLADDERLTDVVRTLTGDVRLGGRTLTAHALVPARGSIDIDVVEGRLPGTASEVLLGLRAAELLRAGEGDLVTARRADGREQQLTVVGTGVVPILNGEQLGLNALLTDDGVAEIGLTPPTRSVVVGVDGDVESVLADLATRYEVSTEPMPPDVDNLRQLGRLPALIGGLVGAIAVVALANALVTGVHRRRRDLALLRTLGFTQRESRRSVLVMALTIAVVGVAVGLPVGLVLGREVWRAVAGGAAVATDTRYLADALALLVLATVAGALAFAWFPARRAAVPRPAHVLRAE